MPTWPLWWEWELELTPHVERRMEDRVLNEIELRTMLGHASGFREDVVEGRFVIDASLRRARWEVIVEPDPIDRLLVVVTAYRIGP